jgi:ABC-type proline/glycine betaine transport system ATPase subunit
MEDGHLVAGGRPEEVLRMRENRFIASFVG